MVEIVDDLVALFNDATVYLYDSAEYWRGRGGVFSQVK